MNIKLLGLLILSIIGWTNSIQSQEANRRPKIGLVLSGGGAKGLAHIGVIKVLEEAGIRPDYITGTSMGSIIGGLYASGYSAAEMDSIIRHIDWTVVLSDQVSLRDVSPVEKNDYNRFQLEFDIVKGSLRLPSGVVRGQRIAETLSELTWHVAGAEHFDDLPIPFRCVAADLISGQPYVFEQGDLMTAMRSSMAIPSVFTPVLLDSMYLVDGGVLDNFPVKVCRSLGADIIIGVNVGFKDYPTVEDLNSLPKVLLNAASIGSNQALLESISLCDYIVTPNLEPFSAGSFFDGVAIMDSGEVAARLQLENFQMLADSLHQIAPQTALNKPVKSETIIISDISIKGREDISLSYFYTNLGFEKGDTITINKLNRGIHKLMGTRFYNKITYRLKPQKDGYLLTFQTEEAHPSKAKFSLRYDNELKAGIVSNLTFRNLLLKNSRASITADISEDPRLSADLLVYIGEKQNLGVLSDYYFERTPLPLYLDNNKKHGIFNYYLNNATVGTLLSAKTRSTISLSAGWKLIEVTQRSGIPEFFENEINRFGNGFFYGQLNLTTNTLNRRYFATKGSKISFNLRGTIDAYETYNGLESSKSLVDPYILVPEKHYIKANLSVEHHSRLSAGINMTTRAAAGVFSSESPFFDMHLIGGTSFNKGQSDVYFAGLNYRERIVENFGLIGTHFDFNLTKVIYANLVINALYSANFGNPRFTNLPAFINQKELIFGASAGVSINSVIGPVAAGLSTNAEDWKPRFYLNIGFPFN